MIKELKKEWMFASRSGRLFILIASFMFLAILTPVMLKVLVPEIFRWQFPNLSAEDVALMVNASQLTAIQGYMGDVFELGMIIIVFSLCGVMAQEIRDNTMVFPIISGNTLTHMILSKVLLFGSVLLGLSVVSILISYGYSGLLFEFDLLIQDILLAGVLQGVYLIFIVTNLVFWGALLKRTLPSGFITLVLAYGLQLISGLLKVHAYSPSGLIDFSSKMTFDSMDVMTSLAVTGVAIAIMLIITQISLKKMEYNIR